jgi:iron complex outermembrane recepter protein
MNGAVCSGSWRGGAAIVFVASVLLLAGASPTVALGAAQGPTRDTPGTLPQGRVPLEGLVLEEDTGVPVSGAQVALIPVGRAVLTGADGTFRLEPVAPGIHRLRVTALGYRSAEREVEVGPDGARVELRLERRPFGLPEVVATGTPLRGTGPYQPSQAFGPEELAVRGANSFGEMLDGEPGLAMRSLGPTTGRPVIRGLDGDRVAVLEGGQRMGDMSETAHDHAVAMEPLLADAVEVVRGPASLLYGSSALGGVVNLLRRDIPTAWAPGLSGTTAVQGATVNSLMAGAGSAVYGADAWALSGRASVRESHDFRAPGSPTGLLESTHSRLATGGAGWAWRGNGIRGGVALDLHGHVYGVPEGLDDPDEEVEIRSRRRRVTGLLDRHRPGSFVESVELRVAGAHYLQREVETERGPDGTAEVEVPHRFDRRTIDATLVAGHGGLGSVGRGALGASVLASRLTARGEEEFHPDGDDLALAVFTFQEVPVGARVALQGGLRLEHGRARASGNEAFPDFSARRTAGTVSGALGVHLRPREGAEVGLQLARAHRTPRLDQLHADGPHIGAARFEVGDPALENELGHGVDVFARYEGRRFHGEAALFRNHIDHFVFPRHTGETDTSSGLPVVRWSASRAVFTGGELSIRVLPLPTVHVRLTGDWVRGAQQEAESTLLPFIPPPRASLGVRYDPGSWWVGSRVRAAAEQGRVPPGQDPTDGYALADLEAGARMGGGLHTLAVRLDNVMDTVYRDHLSRVDERRFPMPGRNLTVVYRRSF